MHAFELNWSEVVVSKMQKCSSETRKKCRVAGREERCERRRRIQKEGSAGPGSRVQQMQVGMKRQVRMDGWTGQEGRERSKKKE